MKVLMVADARSVHTRRWTVSLQAGGVDIVLYSLYPPRDNFFEEHGIRLYVFDLFTYKSDKGLKAVAGMLSKHWKAVEDLKTVIRIEDPDILHAHYATSFGLIAALTGFHPFIISVWGSDVYEFPYLSPVNEKVLRYIFRKADKILSTSYAMARQTMNFTEKLISITPFGVDTSVFKKFDKERNEVLDPELVIIGDGRCREEYERLAEDLGISRNVKFVGKIPNHELPQWYNSFSVAISLSRSESFGVVAVEAMACGCPVVVSDADGFKEVVLNGVTGFVVPRNEPGMAALAIQKFIDDPDLRERLGNKGIQHVKELYSWDDNVATMISIYSDVRKFKG